jgi:diguanylate cyclase (GGDEF)-like protein
MNGRDTFAPLLLADMPMWQRCVAQREVVQYSTVAGCWRSVFPVEGEREVVGLLELETKSVLSSREVILVGAIMRILKNHIALLDYGECDTLTGLLNRKTFESRFDKLRKQLHKASAPANTTEPSWLAIVDIDKFKSINDTYGHLFGDEVLLLVSQLMKRSFRGADLLFRFGGEEFLIVLDHASTTGAAIALDRLRETIATFRFPQVGCVTISLGYTQIDPNDAPSSCVERADAALYYAKHHGRNNIRHYEELIAAGELKVKQDSAAIELF